MWLLIRFSYARSKYLMIHDPVVESIFNHIVMYIATETQEHSVCVSTAFSLPVKIRGFALSRQR